MLWSYRERKSCTPCGSHNIIFLHEHGEKDTIWTFQKRQRSIIINEPKCVLNLTIVILLLTGLTDYSSRLHMFSSLNYSYTITVTVNYRQYNAHGVATGTTEYATRAESLLRHQISATCSRRALFPYSDYSCHVNCSICALSKFPSPCSNFNCCST